MAMGKTLVLDRVAADLARGLTHPAIQRLSSLVAAYPTDLDLRHRLAAVHRRVGNRIQAGRWDYLTIGADSADTTAFERAFPSAMARLRAVRWPYRASAAATSYARNRLAKLMAAAEAEARTTSPTGASAQAAPRRAPLAERVARLRSVVHSWDLRARSRRAALAWAGTVAASVLAVIGGLAVVEWIVQ